MPDNEKAKADSSVPPSDPLSLMASLASTKNNSSSNNDAGSGGNNSDNSALVSLGNASFGFNFDSEGGSNSCGPNSDDSDGQQGGKPASAVASPAPLSAPSGGNSATPGAPGEVKVQKPSLQPMLSSLTTASTGASSETETAGASAAAAAAATPNMTTAAHELAAANAVANLQSITSGFPKETESATSSDAAAAGGSNNNINGQRIQRKRKAAGNEEDGGFNSDDGDSQNLGDDEDGDTNTNASGTSGKKGGKKKKLNERKREERNAREKERSFRISKQINELRDLLSSGGVIVPKGTKSSVLTEAANYIRMLQQHQYRSEIDRHQLVQQMQLIGSGAHGPQAAAAIRHVAAQNGVWSLGNFGGVPPKSSMSFYQGSESGEASPNAAPSSSEAEADVPEYRSVFTSCGIGMALASMGGAFIDANQLFCQLASYTKQELCALTIFNITARQDLQHAFDLISQMISPPVDLQGKDSPPTHVVLRGTMKDRTDLGLSVSLIKGDDGVAKCFCVTLIKSPASPFDTSKPVPVSFESILQDTAIIPQAPATTAAATAPTEPPKANSAINDSAPAFTSG